MTVGDEVATTEPAGDVDMGDPGDRQRFDSAWLHREVQYAAA